MIETLCAPPLCLRLVWKDNGIDRIDLSLLKDNDSRELKTPEGEALQAALDDYVAGKRVQWPDLPLRLSKLPPFTHKVLTILKNKVPPGKTMTYGQLANLAGNPKAGRAVGRALAANPWPLVVPCHRIVARGGGLCGFSAEGGVDLKHWLLELERGNPSRLKR